MNRYLATEQVPTKGCFTLPTEAGQDELVQELAVKWGADTIRDWMAHIHKFIVRFGKGLCDRIHHAGKKAAIFWGDHWIGMEPYLPTFQEMGIDIHINACEGGVVLRRCAEAPGSQTKECRFYPYMFPDTFNFTGGEPLRDSQLFWANIRRALIRAPIGRLIVVNNANETITTLVFDGEGKPFELTLKPYESAWFQN